MGEETAKKEQTEESSSEEQTDKSSKFGGLKGAQDAYIESIKKTQEAKKTEQKEEEDTCIECSASEEELKVEKKAGKETLKPQFFIATEDGKILKPLVGKARGKDYIPDSEEKLQAWLNLGIVSDEELSAIKKEREEMEKVKPFIEIITQAHKEGRLVIKDDEEQGVKKEEETEEEEDTEYVDPKVKELKDRLKELESKLDKGEKEREKEKETQLKAFIEEHRGKMKKEMEDFRAEKYFGADIYLDEKPEGIPLNVWDLMAALDEKGEPKYSLEEAMKISHESQLKFIEKFLTDHPDAIPKVRDKIIGQHYKEKETREEAPEGPPGETPAIPKKEKPKVKGLQDAIDQFNKYYKSKQKAGEAH